MPLTNPALAAVLVLLAYTAVVALAWRLTGTRYDHLVDDRRTVARGIVLPIALGAVVLIAATTWLGWWEDALFPARVGPAWTVVVPVLFALVAVVNLATIDWRSPKARLLPLLLLGVVLVGFAEELATRGQLVVGLREAGAAAWAVWLVSSVLFALLHGINALFGQSARETVTQVIAAFFAGTALYVTVMTTGSLVLAMALHALWDFGSLGVVATGRAQRPLAALGAVVTFAVGAVAVGVLVAS